MLIYIFYILILILTLSVVSAYNPIHSLFYLILMFVCSSLLLFFLQLEFFALIFLIIYIGAILVLFSFVVMMLNLKQVDSKIFIFSYIFIFMIIFFFICFELIFLQNYFLYFDKIFQQCNFVSALKIDFDVFYSLKYINQSYFLNISLTTAHYLGLMLYTYYSLYFILCGIILFNITMGIILLTYISYNDITELFYIKYYQKNLLQYYVDYSLRIKKMSKN